MGSEIDFGVREGKARQQGQLKEAEEPGLRGIAGILGVCSSRGAEV